MINCQNNLAESDLMQAEFIQQAFQLMADHKEEFDRWIYMHPNSFTEAELANRWVRHLYDYLKHQASETQEALAALEKAKKESAKKIEEAEFLNRPEVAIFANFLESVCKLTEGVRNNTFEGLDKSIKHFLSVSAYEGRLSDARKTIHALSRNRHMIPSIPDDYDLCKLLSQPVQDYDYVRPSEAELYECEVVL